MPNPKKPSWLDWLWLAQVFKVTVVVTVLSVGVGWGGWGLWSFFSPPSAPPKKPPSTSETLDKNKKKKEKTASDEDSPSLVAGSETTNLLQGHPETELKTLTAAELDAEYEIRKRKVLIQEIELLISISNSKTAEIEPDWNYLRKVGFSEEVIRLDPTYNLFAVEESIRKEHRAKIQVLQNEINDYINNLREPDEEETSLEISGPVSLLDTPSSGAGSGSGTGGQSSEIQEQSQELPGIDENDDTFALEFAAYQADSQTKKNIALRNNIRIREDLIQEKELLISISNSKIEKLVIVCKLLLALGASEEALRSGAAYRDLTKEVSIRNKHLARIETLENEINDDKAHILEPSHVDKEATENRNEPLPLDEEETSLTRALAIGPVTRYISTSCSSTRAILPIAIPKEKSPSPKEKSPSDSETPRIEWGNRS